MASTFTDALSLEKQATGENSNSWGTNLNGTLDDIDDAIAARLSLSVAGSSNVTLTAAQNLHAWHEYNGTLTGNINVIVTATEKLFFIFNNTSGSYTLTVKTSAGTGVAVTQGQKNILYCDGTNVIAATDFAGLGAQTFTGIQRFTKGGDIASASPLVIDTDGNYFDVTGTTGFTAMTVTAGDLFMLQFDGALTMTHHATNLDLPGEANITTAAGDVGLFYATGSNTVQCISYTKADGTAVVAGAGGGPGKGTAPSTFYRSNAKVQNENITVSDHSTNFTATNATNVLNVGTDDDFANDTNVRLTTSGADLPNGWAIDTDYYVIGATSNTMQIAATVGGAAVTISDDGSGTHTVFEVINATAVGPITIKTGNSLTIPSGSRVVIL